MLEHLMCLTDEQKQLMAYSVLLQFILDENSKRLIKQLGIERVAKEIGGRYKVGCVSIIPV